MKRKVTLYGWGCETTTHITRVIVPVEWVRGVDDDGQVDIGYEESREVLDHGEIFYPTFTLAKRKCLSLMIASYRDHEYDDIERRGFGRTAARIRKSRAADIETVDLTQELSWQRTSD